MLIIITRFYERINLGIGGLIKNYTKCALELINNIEIVEIKV